MKRVPSNAAVRKLTDDETKHAVGGAANPIVVRLAAKAIIAVVQDAYENPINVGGLLEAGKQKLQK